MIDAMKNIIFILSNNLTLQKKMIFMEKIQFQINKINLPFTIELYQQNNTYDFEKYDYAVVSFPPKNVIQKFRKLEFMLTTNAGYDDILDDFRYINCNIGRLIYPPAIKRMSQYVLYCILDYSLLMEKYRKNQTLSRWERTPPFAQNTDELCVGVMGLGYVGTEIINHLSKNDIKVISYSQSKKPGRFGHYTNNQLDEFLSSCNILINALPLTEETKNILNKTSLGKLPDHSCLINISRGGHIVDNDLLNILDCDKIDKAYLDVFHTEPLPIAHPFWNHPKISITPHISGAYDLLEIVEPIIYQCKLFHEKSILEYPINCRDFNII